MKISFVIPAHNEEALLGDCLRAVFKAIDSAGFETEVIVVDNASTDRTREVAAGFARVRVVDEPKKGLVLARRAGGRVASGEILAHIDADTRMPQNWPEQVLAEFEKGPVLAAVSGPYFYYDLPARSNFWVKVFYAVAFVLNWLGTALGSRSIAVLQGGNFAVKKSIWDALPEPAGRFIFYGEDTDLARHFTRFGRVKFSRRLTMPASGRRLAKEGLFKTGVRYGINYFWTLFFNRPFTKKYADVRAGFYKQERIG